jgi:uncharacterized protein related to proFAR isomerase
MTDYLLRNSLSDDDIDFLNETDMEFDIVDTYSVKSDSDVFDSGWCDWATGQRMISHRDRAVFKNVTAAQYTYLQLRYRDRLNELTDGLKGIYNITTT